MPLQFVNISDSKVKFVNEENDPEHRLTEFERNLGNVVFESAMDKMKLSEFEDSHGDLIMEVALLKMGGI